MNYDATSVTDPADLEALLRQELARGDVALAGVAPVLSHLLADTGQSLISDAIVAQMRGMLGDIARQLLWVQAEVETSADEASPGGRPDAASVDALTQRLVSSTVVLSHAYALAVEAHFAGILEDRAGIDPVLSPLLQELIASDQEATAEQAMTAMAAQARFMQAQRRMNLPLGELPSELFHQVLSIWRRFSQDCSPETLKLAEQALRDGHDETSARLGLFNRLVTTMKGGVHAALLIEHAGISIWASSIASVTRQPRELALLSCHEGQVARLALTLRAGGLKPEDVARQVGLIHPEMSLPAGFDQLSTRQALGMLGMTRGVTQSARQA